MLGRAASRLASARSAEGAAAANAAIARRPPPPPFRRRLATKMSGSAGEQPPPPATTPASPAATSTPGENKEEAGDDPSLHLVQYVVLRRDLWREPLCWPLGPVVAQGAHAATAALSQALASGCESARRYTSPANLGHMRKVVLEVEDERRLRALAARLAEAKVGHWLWVEQPEGVATALATWPAARGAVAPHVKKGRLCKAGVGGGAAATEGG